MPRPTNALIVFDIPGRKRGGVRVNKPSAGKASYRVLWRDDVGGTRELNSTDLHEAEAIAEHVARTLAVGEPILPADPTLGDLIVHYLYGAGRSPRWTSEKSVRRIAGVARRILTQADLDLRLSAYAGPNGPAMLQRILDHAASIGCPPGRGEYEKAGILLKTLFTVAERDRLASLPFGNPMQGIRYAVHHFTADPDPQLLTVNYVGPELRPPTERVLDFIDATEKRFGSREARFVEVLAFGGLRPGEACALKPSSLRVDRPGLRITEQLMELSTEDAAKTASGDTLQFRPPKWGKHRNAYYPSSLLERLFELDQKKEGGAAGVLFPTSNGRLRRQSNWRRDVFVPIAKQLGWPTRHVHRRGREQEHFVWPVYAFRHHYANFLLKDLKRPLVSVARFMGHEDVRVTERMYLKTELDDLDLADAAYLTRQGER